MCLDSRVLRAQYFGSHWPIEIALSLHKVTPPRVLTASTIIVLSPVFDLATWTLASYFSPAFLTPSCQNLLRATDLQSCLRSLIA